MGRGLSNSEIAGELTLGEATVKTHVAHILGRLILRDCAHAVVLAYETAMISPATRPQQARPAHERGAGGQDRTSNPE
jgi:Bacterial regulatory proteins, luxR family